MVTGAAMVTGVATAVLAALAFGVASLLQAIGARAEPTTAGIDVALLYRLRRQPAFLASMAFTLCGFVCHLLALRNLPLFAVQPVVASSVAVTAVVSSVLGHEPLGWRGRLLVGSVCIGLALLTSAAVPGSSIHASARERALLLLVVLAITGAGWLGGRVPGPRGATLLGLLSGLGFAVVAVSGRAMPSLAVAALLTDPASYALVAGGAVGFLFYSIALQRGTVITVTAAMVFGNTIAPVLIGLLVLGDRIRDGWAPAVAVGLVLAGTAVVVLPHDPHPTG